VVTHIRSIFDKYIYGISFNFILRLYTIIFKKYISRIVKLYLRNN